MVLDVSFAHKIDQRRYGMNESSNEETNFELVRSVLVGKRSDG